jgi:hypothetical protein
VSVGSSARHSMPACIETSVTFGPANLGGDRGVVPSAKTRAKALAAIEKRVAGRATDIAPTIKELQAAGVTSSNGIAAGLNERGIETARGGQWSVV